MTAKTEANCSETPRTRRVSRNAVTSVENASDNMTHEEIFFFRRKKNAIAYEHVITILFFSPHLPRSFTIANM